MTRWTRTDEQLAAELGLYMWSVHLYGAKDRWTIADKGKPWTDYYSHTSAILRKMRASRRKRVEGR